MTSTTHGSVSSPVRSGATPALALVVAIALAGTSAKFRGPQLLLIASTVGVTLMASEVRRAVGRVGVPTPFVALVLWAAASFGWSVRPDAALWPSVLLGATLVLGLGLCSVDDAHLLAALRVGSIVAIALNLAYQVMFPAAATTFLQGGTQWRGAMPHKQQLGMIAGFAVFVLAHAALSDRRHRFWWAGWAVVASLVLVRAQSSVVIVASACSVGVLVALQVAPQLRRSTRAFVVVAGLAVIAAAIVRMSTSVETLTLVTGKDVTLTGRTLLWPHVLEKIDDRPFQGYGLNALWRIEARNGVESTDPVTTSIWQGAGWNAYSAHSGYLDSALQLGLVGALLALAVIGSTATGYVSRRPKWEGPRMIGMFAFFYVLVMSFAESFVFTSQGLFLVVLAVLLSRRTDADHDCSGYLPTPKRAWASPPVNR